LIVNPRSQRGRPCIGARQFQCLRTALGERLGRSPSRAMEVKNTFIDVVNTSTPLPSPLATAPAKAAFSVQESLLAASKEDEPAELNPLKAKRLSRRAIPSTLDFMSTQSMMSIPETLSPTAAGLGIPVKLGQPVVVNRSQRTAIPDPMQYLSSGTIPATPQGMMEWGATPSGTPAYQSGFTMFAAPPMMTTAPAVVTMAPAMMAPAAAPVQKWSDVCQTPVAAPVMIEAPRPAKFSLCDMISPPAAGVGTLQNAFSAYQPPPPPQYQPAVQMQQTFMAQPPSSVAPTMMASANGPLMAAPSAPPSFLTVAAPAALPSFSTAPTSSMREFPLAAGPSAAVALGLMSVPNSVQVPSPNSIAVGSLPSFQRPVFQQTLGMSAPTVSFGQQRIAAAGVNSTPGGRFVPPPPLQAAPMQVFSPQGTMPPMCSPLGMSAAPTSPESDLKVLLDMAVASGSQKAVDALLRQAAQSGMSEAKIRGMMLPSPAAMVMSTSPVSR